MIEIDSNTDLQESLKESGKAFLLLWKKGSEQSECARKGFEASSGKHPEIMSFAADVMVVRDIHENYGITSVPALLQFDGKLIRNVIKGCHPESFYTGLLEEAVYQAMARESGRPAKNVTVYSTPTCTWCNTLKQWLKKNHIPYSDIDVSRDEHAARELVSRTGQQGVPQTDINGQIVVGFDQARLKQLLEI